MRIWFLWATAAIWFFFLFYWNSTVVPPASCGSAQEPPEAPRAKRPWLTVRFRLAKPGQKATRSESDSSRLVHLILLWGALLLALLPGPGLLGRRWLPELAWWGPIGLAVQIAFAALYLWGKRVLGRNWSGAVMIKEGHRLVREGPYRVVRHPLYTGMIGMFLGTAIVWGEWHALAGLVLCVAAYARKIGIEERQLRQEFGAAYDDYRRATWSLIPGVF